MLKAVDPVGLEEEAASASGTEDVEALQSDSPVGFDEEPLPSEDEFFDFSKPLPEQNVESVPETLGESDTAVRFGTVGCTQSPCVVEV